MIQGVFMARQIWPKKCSIVLCVVCLCYKMFRPFSLFVFLVEMLSNRRILGAVCLVPHTVGIKLVRKGCDSHLVFALILRFIMLLPIVFLVVSSAFFVTSDVITDARAAILSSILDNKPLGPKYLRLSKTLIVFIPLNSTVGYVNKLHYLREELLDTM